MSRPLILRPLADGNSEKYLKKVLGRKDIEDALSKLESSLLLRQSIQPLDRLTQEEARMATAQVLEVAHHVKEGLKTFGEEVKGVDDKVKGVDDKIKDADNKVKDVGDKVKDVDDKVKVAIEGAFSTLATHDTIANSYTTRWQGSQSDDDGDESSGATAGRQYR